jgi:hypothetical protein
MSERNSNSYQSLADLLTEETLQEAADTFFGQRTAIERALEIYTQRVQELQKILDQVQAKQATLHFLLGEGQEQVVKAFYSRIGINPESVPQPEQSIEPELSELRVPFAFRDQTRYVKLLTSVYAQFAATAADYMHGRSYKDPNDSRRQRITVHYDQVYAFYQQLRKQIQKTNQENSPSQVLQFVKQLDVDRAAKESLVSVPLHYTLDQEMAIEEPDFMQSGIVAYPDFPAAERSKDVIAGCAARFFREHPAQARQILEKVRTSGSKGVKP